MRRVKDIVTGQVTELPDLDPIYKPRDAATVKAEAQRRINTVLPEWKQRNLIAHAAVLAEKGRSNWNATDLAAWTAGEAIWAAIKVIRDKSDILEAMDPIPTDYKSDGYWT